MRNPSIGPAFLTLVSFLALVSCGSDPDKRTSVAENKVSSKAVADVDAAMAEARKAAPPAAK